MVDGVQANDIGGAPADDDGPYDFYLSYVPADRGWAEWIAWQIENRLRLDGRRPKLFVRDWHIVVGMHEDTSRHRALSVSARLVAVLTQDYLEGEKYGIEEWPPDGSQQQVVPVRVKECQPGGLVRLVPIELVGLNAAAATDALVKGINEALEGLARPVTAPTYPGRPAEDMVAVPPYPGPPVLVGEPPTVPPNWFQDRNVEVEDIERHLGDIRTGLVMVVGREGFGKTAMIHQLWERIRTDKSPLHVHGLVYLSAHGFWPVTVDRVIDGLIELFPTYEAEQLAATVRQPMPWVEKLDILLTALARRQVIIAIDAIEELLDDDEDIEETVLRELIDYLVPRAAQGVRLLLVGRHAPQAVAQRFPGLTHRRDLDRGLPEKDAFALLEVMDADGRLNLDAVPEHDRARLHRLTAGSPRALELTYGVLAGGDFSFTRLLEFMARADSDGMVVHLLAHACARLSRQDQRVLQALAVFGRAVPLAAVNHLVRHEVPDLDSGAVLGRLRQLRLAQSDGEHFSVPAKMERDYLIEQLRRDADARETPEALMHRAADYFVGQRHPEPRWLADLRPHLIEIELRLRAGDEETAFELMRAVDDEYLHGWGSSSALEPLLRMLLYRKGIRRNLRIDAESRLARALMQQEDHQTAAERLEHALGLAFTFGRGHRRIALREQLTEAYLHQGKLRQAAVHSRQAMRLAIWQLRDRDAMTAVAGLAMCRAREGRFHQALRLFATGRTMLKLIGNKEDRAHRPTMLYSEAWVYGQFGERDRARSLLREGRRHAVALGSRRWEGMCLLSEAQLALDDHNLEHAVGLAEEASAIGVRNGNRALCRIAMEILALARLGQNDLDAAARAADIAQRNRGSVIGFALVGLAAYRRGKDEEARDAFHKGHKEASKRHRANENDFQLLDVYGLVDCGLALLGQPTYLPTALTHYKAARRIATEDGAVDRALMLLKQFEPRADPRILERVRAEAKGEGSGRTLPAED